MKTFIRPLLIGLLLSGIAGIGSCKKENTDPNVLGGETIIDLTAVGSETDVYLSSGSTSLNTKVKVVGNDNGMVSYEAAIDIHSIPDSIIDLVIQVLPQLVSYYNPKDVIIGTDAQGRITATFKLKVTSEGMQNYFVDGKPWTFRYNDAAGTKYTVKRNSGEEINATVTEKTGLDDWPMGFMYIKTSKVEVTPPAADPVFTKITFRANHKFGLVYLKGETKSGKIIEVDLVPWFLI
jgi:hypothetical protein